MPHKPTGRPPGRPKTNWYETLSARVPQDLADQVRKYAARKRQSLSDVFRDGFTLLIQEDRYAPLTSGALQTTEILSDTIQTTPAPEIMSDSNSTQESMPDALHKQRLRDIVSDINEDAPEPEMVSDMNGTLEIMSDTNGAPEPAPLKSRKPGKKRKDCAHSPDRWNKTRRMCLDCEAEERRIERATKGAAKGRPKKAKAATKRTKAATVPV